MTQSEEPVTGFELGKRLCELFELDPDITTSIVISMEPGEMALITIEQQIPERLAAGLTGVVSEYQLRHKPETP